MKGLFMRNAPRLQPILSHIKTELSEANIKLVPNVFYKGVKCDFIVYNNDTIVGGIEVRKAITNDDQVSGRRVLRYIDTELPILWCNGLENADRTIDVVKTKMITNELTPGVYILNKNSIIENNTNNLVTDTETNATIPTVEEMLAAMEGLCN